MKCPICKSNELILDVGGLTGKVKCKNCGYVGVLVLEEFKQLGQASSSNEDEK